MRSTCACTDSFTFAVNIAGVLAIVRLTFWIQGCMHAREWISPATVMYIAEELISSKDPRVQAVVSKIEFAVAPCINPDGYKFTWSTDRLWRKNRRHV